MRSQVPASKLRRGLLRRAWGSATKVRGEPQGSKALVAAETNGTVDMRLVPASICCWVVALVSGYASWNLAAVGAGVAIIYAVVGTIVALGPFSPRARRRSGRPVLVATVVITACLGALLTSQSLRLYDQQATPLARHLATATTVKVQLRIDSLPTPVTSSFGQQNVSFSATIIGGQISQEWHSSHLKVRVIASSAWKNADVKSTAVSYGVQISGPDAGKPTFLKVTTAPIELLTPPRSLDQHIKQAWRRAAVESWGSTSRETAGLLPGMVQGDRGALDPILSQSMKNTGLTHLTAVSGANCTIILAAVTLILRTLRVPRVLAATSCIVALIAFVAVVGPDPSVLRSALMGAIGVAALFGGRPRRVGALLNLSIITLLIADPQLASDFAFILSVLATFGLHVTGVRCAHWLSRWIPVPLAQIVAIPLVAQLFCAPVIVLLQPQLTSYAVVANVVVAPVVPLVTLVGSLGMCLAWFLPPVGMVLAGISGVGAWWVATVAQWIASLPGSSLQWPDGWRGAMLMATMNGLILLIVAGLANPTSFRLKSERLRKRMGPRLRPLISYPLMTLFGSLTVGGAALILIP